MAVVAIPTNAARPHRVRRLVVAGTLALLLVAIGSWVFSRTQASGDPGGKILNQLVPAASALPGYGTSSLPWVTRPPAASDSYLIKSEPGRDSCDGMAGTQGWSQVAVQGSFRWAGSDNSLIESVNSKLSAIGWHQTQIANQSEGFWKKRLTNGSIATAMLNLSPQGDPFWGFVVTAPPAGKAASGC